VSRSENLSVTERVDLLKHGDDVFRRHTGHDVMNLLEDVTTPGSKGSDIATGVFPYLFWSSKGKHPLGITSPTPEDYVFSEFPLQFFRLHVSGGNLNRLDHVKTRFDEVRKELIDTPATVERHFKVWILLFRRLPHHPVAGFKEFPVHGRGNLWTGLHPQVIPKSNDIHVRTPDFQKLLQIPKMKLQKPVQKAMDAGGIEGHFGKEVIDAKDKLRSFQEISPKRSIYSPVGRLSQSLGVIPLFFQRPGIGRSTQAEPHHLGKIVFQPFEGLVGIIGQREITLFKVETSRSLDADRLPFVTPHHPALFGSLHLDKGRYLAGGSIG